MVGITRSKVIFDLFFFRRTKSNLTEYVNSSTTTKLGELGLLLMKQGGNANEIPTADEMKWTIHVMLISYLFACQDSKQNGLDIQWWVLIWYHPLYSNTDPGQLLFYDVCWLAVIKVLVVLPVWPTWYHHLNDGSDAFKSGWNRISSSISSGPGWNFPDVWCLELFFCSKFPTWRIIPGLGYVVNNHGDRFCLLNGVMGPLPSLLNGGDPNHVSVRPGSLSSRGAAA